MTDQPTWESFYKTLNRLGPRLLRGVHPDLAEFVSTSASDSDDFWSGGLEGNFDLWREGQPEKAVELALNEWVWNVKRHLGEILGPDSLIPFENYGITNNQREDWRQSVEGISLALDDRQLQIFIDSVLLGSGTGDPDSPTLVVNAIVEPYARVPDGQLIQALATPWRAVIRALKHNWHHAFEIPPAKWEELVAGAFDLAGYDEVILTPRSGDHGRDVIAVKRGVGSIRIIGSVKAYKPGHLVRYDDVRALAGVLLGDPQATKGIVTTTSAFPRRIEDDPFLKPLIPYRLELMDGDALKRWLEGLALT